MASIDGLISGLNTTQIITSLMAVERSAGRYLTDGKTASQSTVTVLQGLNTALSRLRTVAQQFVPDSISGLSAWRSTTAVSSSSALATATTGPAAGVGSATFTVRSVATAGAAVSTGTVGTTSAPVAGGPFLLSKGASALGIADISAGAGLSTGPHALEVTQSSAGGRLGGSSPLVASTTIDGGNGTLSVFLDGSSTATTFTLTAGTYTPDQLAAEIGRASGGVLDATIGADGSLQLATTHEGSSASLQLAVAQPALGLGDTATVAVGTDAVVSLDGVATTVASLTRGTQLTLAGAGGDSLVFTLSGGLRSGAATSTLVDVAPGASLSQVVSTINGAGAGVRAVAVQVSSSAYRLQLTSTTTGAGSGITLSADAFPGALSTLGRMVELQAGADTVLHVGTGAGAFDVVSPTSTVTGLLPDVTVTAVKADSSTPVTVTVTADAAGMADRMADLVSAVNDVLGYVRDKSTYEADSKTAGPLLGSSMARDLVARLTSSVIGTSSALPALAGAEVTRDGTVTFDRDAFLAAYDADPAKVAATMTTMASALSGVAKAAGDPVSGYVTAQIDNARSRVRDYTDQITAFEARMDLRQQALQRQYTALETMLGTLQSQSQWLAGQIAALPRVGSSGS